MRYFILLFSLSLCIPRIVLGQNGPKMAFERFIIDYGTQPFGSNGERLWTFKNAGTEPLLITNVKGSCGCTVAKYPKSPILPGKEGIIKIQYDTKRTGNFAKTISITTNENEPENFHVIKIMGQIEPSPTKENKNKSTP